MTDHGSLELERALLQVARTVEKSLAKRAIFSVEGMRSALGLVHDMQREARDGTLRLVALSPEPAQLSVRDTNLGLTQDHLPVIELRPLVGDALL